MPADRILYWDKFSRPEVTIKSGVMTGRWWFDEKKAERLATTISEGGSLLAVEEGVEPVPMTNWRSLLLLLLLVTGIWSMARYLRGRS